MDEQTELKIKTSIKNLLRKRINWVGEEEQINNDLYGLTNDLFEIVIHSLKIDIEN